MFEFLFYSACGDGAVALIGEHPWIVRSTLSTPSCWAPLCGHYFWNNLAGLDMFCKKLGYNTGGAWILKKEKLLVEAWHQGECRPGIDTSLDGCTSWCNEIQLGGEQTSCPHSCSPLFTGDQAGGSRVQCNDDLGGSNGPGARNYSCQISSSNIPDCGRIIGYRNISIKTI